MSQRKVGLRVAQSVVGVLVGLAVTEGAFHLRDHGAFPHLNVFVADPVLGVRMRPGATEKISFSGNPVTSVRINDAGFRGGPLPAPSQNEIVVVGDSQVFGLGVEEDETFSSLLSKQLSQPVTNAGVVTYGPPEYAKVIDDLLASRHPKTVVYVVNAVNDFFEAERPNVQRHAVWDGWAVRREMAPASYRDFPGRAFLYRDSHAFFALRALARKASLGDSVDDRALPSEGTWTDLLGMVTKDQAANVLAAKETERLGDEHDIDAAYATETARSTEAHVRALVFSTLKVGTDGSYFGGDDSSIYQAADANPGDIVSPGQGEDGRPLSATVEYVRRGAELRTKFEAALRKRAEARADEEVSKEITRSLEERDRAKKKLADVLAAPMKVLRQSSPMVRAMLDAKARVEKAGARFVLVTLPIDVAVSPDEWKKYGHPPLDVSATRSLLTELVDAAHDEGASALDATDALTAAEPGAFLNGDIHMTPKGHLAVATALAKVISEPAPAAKLGPLTGLALGRSRAPKPEEWSKIGEVGVPGSSAAGCVTKKIREWLLVRCARKGLIGPVPRGITIVKGGRGEAMTFAEPGWMSLIAPIPQGDSFSAILAWEGETRTLDASFPDAKSTVPDITISASKLPPPASKPDGAATVCACFLDAKKATSCNEYLGGADTDCARTYAKDCPRMLACATGDPVRGPTCPQGFIAAGAMLHCAKLCTKNDECESGTCIDEQGAKRCE